MGPDEGGGWGSVSRISKHYGCAYHVLSRSKSGSWASYVCTDGDDHILTASLKTPYIYTKYVEERVICGTCWLLAYLVRTTAEDLVEHQVRKQKRRKQGWSWSRGIQGIARAPQLYMSTADAVYRHETYWYQRTQGVVQPLLQDHIDTDQPHYISLSSSPPGAPY